MGKGLIHLYTGDGKGKTTAAAGLAARAAGYGRRVVFTQFLKGRRSGETSSLEQLGIRVVRSDRDFGFVWDMDDEEKRAFRDEQMRLLEETRRIIADKADLLALDEALGALETGLLDEQELSRFIAQKPEGLELVLTGRNAPEWLVEKADYVTEMKKIKHPFDLGVSARKSIEY